LQTEEANISTPGKIGVGTWNTQAEFKDIKVTKGSQTLFESDFSKPLQGWRTARGQWQVLDGVLRQGGEGTDVRPTVGDASWSDYTLSLKARKTGGAEGFLVLFQLPDDKATTWWNIGGWGNRQHGLEVPGVTAPRATGSIETGRWYDVRVEVQGASIRCYLNGHFIHDVRRASVKNLYAVASRQNKTGEVILKVVNPGSTATEAAINLRGARRIAPTAKA
jgi:alpha-L-arabinofuranosidase